MLAEDEQEKFEEIIERLGEFFPNYAVSVLSVENELLHCEYSSWRIGRMLYRDSLEEMERDMNTVCDMEDWMDFEDMEGEEGYE